MSGQSFSSLPQKPLSVDLTVENGQRLKVIYGSHFGFHAIDVDSGTPFDLYLPSHVSDSANTGAQRKPLVQVADLFLFSVV